MADIFSDELKIKLLIIFSKNIKFLTEKYGKVQVNPREINLFI